jgi:CubicO group peptidase (beta-lactamase class C family)
MQLDADKVRRRLEPLFRENFEKFGELGAAVSVWQNGEPLLDLHGGFRDAQRAKPWTNDTIVLIWSATKGLGSACLLHVLQEHRVDIGQRVAGIWPEFGQAGKEHITLAQLLSHQAGLCALDEPADLLDYEEVIRALEKQQPLWPPGTGHGYHARTFGFLLDELVRRIAGKTLSDYWQRTFALALNLDLWIGLPETENDRVATMYPAKAGRPTAAPKIRASNSDFYQALATSGTLANRAFTSPRGLQAVNNMNKAENRAQPIVSFGGIGSANSLAKFYGMLANGGTLQDRQFFTGQTLGWMTTTLSDEIDRVFQMPTAFSAGFMKDSDSARHRIFGKSLSAFGHPGAGGGHAFADPECKISFAYVMNQMEQSVLPTEKALRLVDVIYS